PILALSDALRASLLTGGPEVGALLDGRLRERRGASESPVAAENVCGLWPGSDPALRNEVILVSAHYDHVGASGELIYNGADDNGSGTSGLLALADALAEYGPMRRSVMLIWVSGEEKGLWGSKAWALRPSLPEGMRAVANINIDMIGRNAPQVLYVTPSSKHEGYNGLTRLMERFGAEEGFGGFPEGREQGFDGLGSADDYYGRSDHAEFAKLGIPVCFLFSGVHEDYHQATDTVDKIDFDKIRRVVRVVIKALDALQGEDLRLVSAPVGAK
ncbi:MAG: M28 family peptidase, partial [Planctomycetes bacterium]|nr:M28 family peptidase [Planctomycetota bacterium]